MPLFGRNKDKDKDKDKNEPAEPAKDRDAEKPIQNTPENKPEPGETPHSYEAHPPISENAPIPQGEQKPSLRVPDDFDFNRYFLPDRRIMLENVSYETQRPAIANGQLRLNVKDTLVAQLLGHTGVKITYNRMLRFEPEGPFTLSVSFSVLLIFNPTTLAEVDWKTLDMAELFKRKCPALAQTMITKTALLIAEITDANGTPILPVGPR